MKKLKSNLKIDKSKLKVLFISYGKGLIYENRAGVLDRHIKYSGHFELLDILYLTKRKLPLKKINNLTIIPIYSSSYVLSFLKSVFINAKKYDVITTQDPFLTGLLGLIFKLRFSSKLHIQNHSNFIDNRHWINENLLINYIQNFVAKKITIPRADRLRVVNSYEKQIYFNKLKIPESKIDVTPIPLNPIFSKKITEKELIVFKKKYNIKTNSFKIGWAGRFVRLKRLDYLFELTGLLNKKSNIELILAGDYKISDYNLSNLEKMHKLNPIYTGLLPPQELAKFYKSIDVLVLTSDYEGYGMVLAEALECNTPVLVSNHSKGTNDIVLNNKNAYRFNSADDFKSEINKLKKRKKTVFKKNIFNETCSVESIKKTVFG